MPPTAAASVVCVFGRHTSDDPLARASSGPNAQTIKELVAATTGRRVRGPSQNGHFSYHLMVAAGTAPVGTLTIWYSNLPDPDPTNDAHWVQDTSIASVDLSVVANTFINVGNVNAEFVRFKVTRSGGTIELGLYARVEGEDNR